MRRARRVAANMGVVAFATALLAGCSSTPSEGTVRVEVALPEQAKSLVGEPIARATVHADDAVSIQLIRIGGAIAMHHHAESEEIVYLVSGEGVLHVRGGDQALEAGDLVVVPRNTPHGFTPTGTMPAVVLSTFVPTFVDGDVIRDDLREAPPK